MINRKIKFIIIIILIFLIIYGFYSSNQKNTILQYKDYNIIIIAPTPLRYDALGCNNPKINNSTNIDKFAEQTIIFDNAYTTESFTVPAIVSLFTGLYPNFHKINQFKIEKELDESIKTLPEILKENGYRTMLFDSHNYFTYKDGPAKDFDYRIVSGMKDTESLRKIIAESKENKFFLCMLDMDFHVPYSSRDEILYKYTDRLKISGINSEDFLAEKMYEIVSENPELLFTEKAFDEYNEIFKKKNKAERIQQIGELIEKLRAVEAFKVNKTYMHRNPHDIIKLLFWNLQGLKLGKINKNLKKDKIEYLRQLYYAQMYEYDKYFGKFIEILKENSIYDKSIIIFMSSHGEMLLENGVVGHNVLAEHVLHVPLIFYIPGLSERTRIKMNVSVLDIMPSVLKLLGLEIPKYIHGEDIIGNVLENKSGDPKRVLFAEHYTEGEKRRKTFSAISGDFMYIARYIGNNRSLFLATETERLYNKSKRGYKNIASEKMEKTIEMRKILIKSYEKMAEDLKGIILPEYRIYRNEKDKNKRIDK